LELSATQIEGGVTLIELRGRLDIQGAAAIQLEFNATASSRTALVVDITAVDYVSSLGIRMLLAVGKEIAARHGKMALLRPQPAVAGVLHTAGIDRLIPVYETREAAIKAVMAA
jgi:stage II sporulation protein AA (anti-sigma F factor antagonist)